MIPWEEIRDKPYRRWFQFGWRSPNILYRRLRHKYRMIFRARMMWQRARRGWSVEDCWGLHSYLEDVIIGAVGHMREISHGYPSGDIWDEKTSKIIEGEMTHEKWLQILAEIIAGIKAAKIYEDTWKWEEGGEEAFNLAMDHLKKWWFALWD